MELLIYNAISLAVFAILFAKIFFLQNKKIQSITRNIVIALTIVSIVIGIRQDFKIGVVLDFLILAFSALDWHMSNKLSEPQP